MTPPKSRRALKACCAAHTLHDGLSDLTYVLLPLLAQTFGLTLAQVGLIRAAHRTAMAAFQIPAGLVAERFGERNLLAAGTLFAGAGFAALGHVSGFWMLLLALFFAGAGSAVQHPLCSTIISKAYPEAGRRAALGTYNLFGDVGKFAFGGLLSLLLMAGYSWQGPVTLYGIAGMLVAGASFFWIASSPVVATATAGRPSPRGGWGIRNRRGFTALCLIEIVDSSTRVGFLTLIAFLMIDKGLSTGWAALSVPLVLVGGMAGKLACGLLAERVGIVRTIVITEVATGVGILGAVALPGIAAFLLLPLLGIVLQGTSSVLYATTGDLVEQDRLPRAFGLIYTLGSICGIAAPLGYGLAGDHVGVSGAVTLMGLAIFLVLPLTALLRPAITAEPVRI
ncbi:MAG: MFS transporter [Burkholderiales bacterium]|nr:MFS transporter [Burkholderiales bacterium]MDP2397639.1 MFS transporter [Burkholderiales bacterium]